MDSDTIFENAQEAVLNCQAYLVERGERTAAVYLEGLDITDKAGASAAYKQLVAAESHVQDALAQHMFTSALWAVERALQIASTPDLCAVA